MESKFLEAINTQGRRDVVWKADLLPSGSSCETFYNIFLLQQQSFLIDVKFWTTGKIHAWDQTREVKKPLASASLHTGIIPENTV